MEMTLPVASWHPNPLEPGDRRKLSFEPFLEGETLAEYFLRMGWEDALDYPAKAFVGGVEVAKQWWLNVKPKMGTQVSVHAALSGDDSDVGQVLLTLAVAVAAFYAPTYFLMQGTWQGAVMSAAISIGGSLIVSSLFPPPDPTNKMKEEDPVYSISSASNQYRHYEPVTLLCGRRRVFPDVDEKPFTYFKDNEQFLHQTFNFGLGDLEVSDHKLGDATLESLGVAGLEIPDTTVANVDTEAGNELLFSTGFVQRTGPLDTTAIEVDVSGILVVYDEEGGQQNGTCVFALEYSPIGANTWTPFSLDPVVVGYTPSSYEQVQAFVDGETGAVLTPMPAGEGWELWNDNTGEFSG